MSKEPRTTRSSESKASSGSTMYAALSYDDPKRAIEWLERAFGFKAKMVSRDEKGRIAHAELALDGAVVMLGAAQPERGWLSPRSLDGVNQTLYVAIDDPDQHYQTARAAGAEIVIELEDKDYGSREYSARDLEGHVWSFGTYRPGAYWE